MRARYYLDSKGSAYTFARVVILSIFVALGTSQPAFAQEAHDANPFTVNFGAGGAFPSGNYAQGSGAYALVPASEYSWGLDRRYSLNVGLGFALIRQDEQFRQRHWSLYLTGDFMFNPASINTTAVNTAVNVNPQTPSLLSANAGKEDFYSFTLGPSFRFQQFNTKWPHWPIGVYVSGGFGGLRRMIDFTGLPVEGTVLQSTSPVVYRVDETSGAFSAAIGANIGRLHSVGNLMFYVEIRAVHGLGINSGTTWAPMGGLRW